jgi:hypothetical protein
MTEAWLLMDESAIRQAAGNPNGQTALNLPRISELEDIPDPKDMLYRALRTASGRTGRRLEQFRENQAVHLIFDRMKDIFVLKQLSAFRALEEDIRKLGSL